MVDEKHVLRQMAIGIAHEIPLSQERFEDLRAARKGIARMLGVEGKFDLVMENYAEFESELLTRTAHSVLFSEISWEHFMSMLALVNRRLLNVLAAARMYVDQIPHDLKELGFNPETFEAAARAQYDDCLGYRVMVALRNYAQHRGTVAQGLGYAWPRASDGGREHTLGFTLGVAELQADAAFKKPVLNELLALGTPKVELKPLVRGYIASLNKLHRSVRDMTKPQLDQWVANVSGAVDEYRSRFGQDATGLAAARIRLQDGQERGVAETIYLMDDLQRRLDRLSQRNACRTGLETHSVTSR